jgi:hypothetical protein
LGALNLEVIKASYMGINVLFSLEEQRIPPKETSGCVYHHSNPRIKLCDIRRKMLIQEGYFLKITDRQFVPE